MPQSSEFLVAIRAPDPANKPRVPFACSISTKNSKLHQLKFYLESNFEEGLPSSGQIALANDTGRNDSKIRQMLDVPQVLRPADFHSVQNIVEIYPQLRFYSFAEEEQLGKPDSLVALKRVSGRW